MASNRIVINRTTALGNAVAAVIVQGAIWRERLAELNNILGADGYNGDASLITDLGLADAAHQTTLQNLVVQANNEMNNTASTQVNVGAATGTKQLLDALSMTG